MVQVMKGRTPLMGDHLIDVSIGVHLHLHHYPRQPLRPLQRQDLGMDEGIRRRPSHYLS